MFVQMKGFTLLQEEDRDREIWKYIELIVETQVSGSSSTHMSVHLSVNFYMSITFPEPWH